MTTPKPRLDRPEFQLALQKRLQDPYSPVPNTRDITSTYLNNEYDRLRSLDNAGIKHRMFMDDLAFRSAHSARMGALEKQKLDIEAKQTKDAKRGALIGNLLNVVGIAYNVAEKDEQKVLNRQKEVTNAQSRMDTYRFRRYLGGTPSADATNQFKKDWAFVHKTDPNPEPNYDDTGEQPGIMQRIIRRFK